MDQQEYFELAEHSQHDNVQSLRGLVPMVDKLEPKYSYCLFRVTQVFLELVRTLAVAAFASVSHEGRLYVGADRAQVCAGIEGRTYRSCPEDQEQSEYG